MLYAASLVVGVSSLEVGEAPLATQCVRGLVAPAEGSQCRHRQMLADHLVLQYAASLRLEGFNTSPNDGYRRLPTREPALMAIRIETAITAGSRG